MAEDLLQAAVNATLARRDADRQSADLQRERDIAIWRLGNEQGHYPRGIASDLRAALVARGLSEDEIDGLGVSYARVRQIVENAYPGATR